MKETILVVDDNEELIELLEKALGFNGYKVAVAKNGLEAVEMAGMLKPDIILMDMFMPNMDGVEAISRIRSDPNSENIPILAVTGSAAAQDRERCVGAGCNYYITKPYSFVELIAAIKETLARSEANYT